MSDFIDLSDPVVIKKVRELQALTNSVGCALPSVVMGKPWWDRLVTVYKTLNLLGKTFDNTIAAGKEITEDQMKTYRLSIGEFYKLLELCGVGQESDPTVDEEF